MIMNEERAQNKTKQNTVNAAVRKDKFGDVMRTFPQSLFIDSRFGRGFNLVVS